jgi:hypothetical protein
MNSCGSIPPRGPAAKSHPQSAHASGTAWACPQGGHRASASCGGAAATGSSTVGSRTVFTHNTGVVRGVDRQGHGVRASSRQPGISGVADGGGAARLDDGDNSGELLWVGKREGSKGGWLIDDSFHGRVELTDTMVVVALRVTSDEKDRAPTVQW